MDFIVSNPIEQSNLARISVSNYRNMLTESQLMHDQVDDKNYLWHPPTKKLIKDFNITKNLREQYKSEIKRLIEDQMIIRTDFRAFCPTVCLDESTLNLYESPANKFGLEPQGTIPTVYEGFLSFLFPDANDREYVLDWVSASIKYKNVTFLVLVSEEGVGKGIFVEHILKPIHGNSNYQTLDDNTLNNRFNGELENKTLWYADEIAIDNVRAENSLKLLVNDNISIEDKGIKKKKATNYASLVISSNNVDAIPLRQSARRLSIPQISQIKLIDSPFLVGTYGNNVNALLAELGKPENLTGLYRYLYHRDITQPISSPLKGEHFTNLMEQQQKDWEADTLLFIDNYKGDMVDLRQVQAHVSSIYPKLSIGLKTIRKFITGKYDKFYKVTVNNKTGSQRVTKLRHEASNLINFTDIAV